MATTTLERPQQQGPDFLGQAKLYLGMLGLIVVIGLVLGVLGYLAGLLPGMQELTLSRLVQRFLIDWPAGWGWLPEWARPQPWMAAPLTSVIAWALLMFVFVLPMVTYQIYALRKVIGFMQARLGPTQVGPEGLLQTPADVLKLLTKEDVIPRNADRLAFLVAPYLVLVPSFMAYLVVPFGNTDAAKGYSLVAGNLNVAALYLLAITSVAVIGIVSAGWGSGNKYSLLGGMRSAAQLVTYEIPMSLAVVAPVLAVGSLNLQKIVEAQDHLGTWLIWPWYTAVAAALFGVSMLAELNHVPFDLPEAESELVSGFNTEYSGMRFAMFFLAEFANAFTLCAIFVTLFCGGWQSPFPASWPVLGWDHGVFALFWFFLKSLTALFCLFWIRATVPRVRIDQLMAVGWKLLIPVGVVNIFVVAVLAAKLG